MLSMFLYRFLFPFRFLFRFCFLFLFLFPFLFRILVSRFSTRPERPPKKPCKFGTVKRGNHSVCFITAQLLAGANKKWSCIHLYQISLFRVKRREIWVRDQMEPLKFVVHFQWCNLVRHDCSLERRFSTCIPD